MVQLLEWAKPDLVKKGMCKASHRTLEFFVHFWMLVLRVFLCSDISSPKAHKSPMRYEHFCDSPASPSWKAEIQQDKWWQGKREDLQGSVSNCQSMGWLLMTSGNFSTHMIRVVNKAVTICWLLSGWVPLAAYLRILHSKREEQECVQDINKHISFIIRWL